MTPAKISFKLYCGSTFAHTLRWESDEKVYVPISNVTKSAPVTITAAGHGVPQNWRVKLTGIGGMKELNSADYVIASVVSTDTVTINSINATGYTAYSSGGVLEYNKPMDLARYTARMQIRSSIASDVVLAELTTESGGIIIDNILKTITIHIPSNITAQFSFKTAVYSLELIDIASSIVTTFAQGSISAYPEVTR